MNSGLEWPTISLSTLELKNTKKFCSKPRHPEISREGGKIKILELFREIKKVITHNFFLNAIGLLNGHNES